MIMEENLAYFFKVMDDGGYDYRYFFQNFLMDEKRNLSDKLINDLSGLSLCKDHYDIRELASKILMDTYSEEDIEEKLGNISREEADKLNLKKIMGSKLASKIPVYSKLF